MIYMKSSVKLHIYIAIKYKKEETLISFVLSKFINQKFCKGYFITLWIYFSYFLNFYAPANSYELARIYSRRESCASKYKQAEDTW